MNYDPNQQGFHNDQTTQFSSQQPPPPPYLQSGQYQPALYPQTRVSKSRAAWQWYRRRNKPIQIGLGCLGLFVAFMLCGICSGTVAVFNTPPTETTVQQHPAPTSTPHLVARVQPTNTPTPIPPAPTAIPPTPTPTPIPPTPKPIPPTQPPAPTQAPPPPPPVTGVGGNPYGYDFNPGSLIYSPASDICNYISCISSFWNGRGYVEECGDQTFGKSGGISGSCSRHGGNLRPLYSH